MIQRDDSDNIYRLSVFAIFFSFFFTKELISIFKQIYNDGSASSSRSVPPFVPVTLIDPAEYRHIRFTLAEKPIGRHQRRFPLNDRAKFTDIGKC